MSNNLNSRKHRFTVERLGKLIIETARRLGVAQYNAKNDAPSLVTELAAVFGASDVENPFGLFTRPMPFVGKYVSNGNAIRTTNGDETKHAAPFRAMIRALGTVRPDFAEACNFDPAHVDALGTDALETIRQALSVHGIDVENAFFYALTTDSEAYRSPVSDAFRLLLDRVKAGRGFEYTINGKRSVDKAIATARAQYEERIAEAVARQNADAAESAETD